MLLVAIKAYERNLGTPKPQPPTTTTTKKGFLPNFLSSPAFPNDSPVVSLILSLIDQVASAAPRDERDGHTKEQEAPSQH